MSTPGALLGRSEPGEWKDAVGGDVGSEPGVARPPGAPLLAGPGAVLSLVPGAPGAPSVLCVSATRAERSAAGPDKP